MEVQVLLYSSNLAVRLRYSSRKGKWGFPKIGDPNIVP